MEKRGIYSDRLFSAILMVCALAVFLYAKDWQMEAGLYPRAIAVLIFALSLWLFLFPQNSSSKTIKDIWEETKKNWRVPVILLIAVLFILSIEVIGFFVGLPIFIVAIQLLMGERNIKLMLLSTVLITVVIYLVFVVILSIRIPIAFWMM